MTETQYWIAQGENVQGTFTRAKLLGYIQSGRVRKEMKFSVDGGAWVSGSELPELFPAAAAPAASTATPPPMPAKRAAPSPASAPSRRRAAAPAPDPGPERGGMPRRTRVADRPRRGPPGGFLMASIMDFVFAGVGIAGGGFVAWASGRALEAVERDPEMMIERLLNPDLVPQLEALVTMGWIFVIAGVIAGVAGLYVRTGTPEARTTQFIVSILCIGVCVYGLVNGWVGFVTLAGVATQAAAIFLMVQLKPAGRAGAAAPSSRRGRRRR